ncbi:MAG TPA: YdcF family protein [Pyrinomonadaceae bacterium]|nr:YdcF family protein [Pyrinomonadaceae bacterium]
MRARRRTAIKILLVCVLLWPCVAWVWARLLIIQAPLAHADAIVVLGGSANYRERAREAARLLQEGRAPIILLTNDNLRGPWSSIEQKNPFFYERSFDEIENAGVPAEKIEVLMQPVNHTHEEAELVRRYALDHGIRSVLIVTSAYHSRRALWTFSRVFRDTDIIVGLIPASPGGETPRPATWWLTARGWKLVPTEYVKMIYYVVKYR